MPLKNRNTLILFASSILAVGAVLYGYAACLAKPLRQDIADSQSKVDVLRGKLNVTRARAQQLGQLQQEMANLQVELADLEKQLPKTRELPALLRVLAHRAEGYGITVGTFSPQKPVAKGLYDEIPYNLSITASYHSLARFLVEMGKGDRLFAARNLALTAGASKTDPAKTVDATFQLIAFQYHG